MSRLRQAHEGLIQSRAQFLPQVSGSGGYSRSFDIAGASTVTLPDGTVTTISRNSGDSFSVGGNVSYQLGLFGEVGRGVRSEEHTSELQSLMRISYAVFCLKKRINTHRDRES